jgi:hypothetical protein
MSYPPNHPAITSRAPQNCMHIAGATSPTPQASFTPTHSRNTSSSSNTTTSSWSSASARTISVKCANGGCNKMAHVVPFGNHYGESMNVKVNCRDCCVPLVVARMVERMVERMGESVEEQREEARAEVQGGGVVTENWDGETIVKGNGDGRGW